MALTRTAAQLTADVRNRTDHKVGTFRSDAEIRRYLSESCRSLVSKVVDNHGEMYWATTALRTVAATELSIAWSADMWKLLFARVTLDGERVRIGRADVDEIDMQAGIQTEKWTASNPPKLRQIGRRIYFSPSPSQDYQVTLYYVSTAIFFNVASVAISELAATDDYFDGVFGWEQWVVLDAAIKLLNDEGKNTTALAVEKAERWQEICDAAANQHADEPLKVRDRWQWQDPDGVG